MEQQEFMDEQAFRRKFVRICLAVVVIITLIAIGVATLVYPLVLLILPVMMIGMSWLLNVPEVVMTNLYLAKAIALAFGFLALGLLIRYMLGLVARCAHKVAQSMHKIAKEVGEIAHGMREEE